MLEQRQIVHQIVVWKMQRYQKVLPFALVASWLLTPQRDRILASSEVASFVPVQTSRRLVATLLLCQTIRQLQEPDLTYLLIHYFAQRTLVTHRLHSKAEGLGTRGVTHNKFAEPTLILKAPGPLAERASAIFLSTVRLALVVASDCSLVRETRRNPKMRLSE